VRFRARSESSSASGEPSKRKAENSKSKVTRLVMLLIALLQRFAIAELKLFYFLPARVAAGCAAAGENQPSVTQESDAGTTLHVVLSMCLPGVRFPCVSPLLTDASPSVWDAVTGKKSEPQH